MASRPWMPLYVADYFTDTLDLNVEEHACYLLLLMIAWRRPDGALPNDMKFLKRSLSSCVSDMHGNRFNRIVPKLLERYFQLGEDNQFRNKRLTNEREKAEKLSEKQKQNVGKRWSQTKENKDLADTNVIPLQSQSQSQPQKKKGAIAPSARAKVVKIPIPPDFKLTPQLRQYAFDHGADDPTAVENWFRQFYNRARKDHEVHVDWDWACQESFDKQISWARERRQRERLVAAGPSHPCPD